MKIKGNATQRIHMKAIFIALPLFFVLPVASAQPPPVDRFPEYRVPFLDNDGNYKSGRIGRIVAIQPSDPSIHFKKFGAEVHILNTPNRKSASRFYLKTNDGPRHDLEYQLDFTQNENPIHIDTGSVYFVAGSVADQTVGVPIIKVDSISKVEIFDVVAKGDLKQLLSLQAARDNWQLEVRDDSGMTPLLVAAREGKAKVVTLLLIDGSDINAQCDNGSTALHLAALNGYPELVRQLLLKHADPSIRNAGGETALEIAVREKQREVLKVFKSFGLQ